ncbi:phage holin family protein [Pseudonocardia kujensis]|uniref:phage holin family protein n=1 Tax=Pseudonocardia kujensis TaxID=1128675 RepID=UPI001E3D888C|nr:phage holin family protein [Pseudonocardia kujensis]MCE0767118.1 phage holin family protein [Pseudonocardia kujensis]
MTEGNARREEPLRALTEDVRALVRTEVRAMRDDLLGELGRARTASLLLGGAGLLGLLATGSSAALLMRLLDGVLPRAASAAVVTGLYGGAAGALAAAGLAEARRVRDEVSDTVGRVRDEASAVARP